MRKNIHWLLLVGLLLLGFGLRLLPLSGRDLWGDEAYSVAVIQLPLSEIVRPLGDSHPPLFHVLMTGWIHLAGISLPAAWIDPFPIRFGSLIMSMLALPIVYVLARRLFGRRAALLALFLAAIAPMQIYYAGELRMYALLLLTTLASAWAFVRLTQRPGRAAWLFYLGMTLAAMYAHYNAFWVIAAENLIALFAPPWHGRRLKWIGGQALLAVIYLPWALVQVPYLFAGEGGPRRAYTLLSERIASILGQSLRSWTAGAWGNTGIVALLAAAAGIVGVVIAIIAARRSSRWGEIFLLAWAALTLVMVVLADPLMPFFNERFALAGLPAFVTLAAAGSVYLARRSRIAGAVLIVPLIVGGLIGNFQVSQALEFERQTGYAAAMRAIDAERGSDDLILFSNEQQAALVGYYTPPQMPGRLLSAPTINSPQTNNYLSGVVDRAGRVWLVEYGDPIGYDSMRLVPEWLAEHGFRQRFFSYEGGTVSLYVMGEDDATMHDIDAQFGESIRLTGYRLMPENALPGDVLRLSLRWETLAPPPARYTVGNYILNESGQLVAQTDAEPRGGASPTDTWQIGDVIEDRYAIELPPDLLPGTYRLAVGLYAWPDPARIPVQGGEHVDNALFVASFDVGRE